METPLFFITIGLLFLAGLAADEVGRRTRIPRVTLLLLCGLAVGRSGFNLIPAEIEAWFDFLSIAALTMVAFLLGGTFTRASLARNGKTILYVSISIVIVTIALVSIGLVSVGLGLPAALILGAIAAATDPAATSDAIRQTGRTGKFVETIRGIIAIDDAWGLVAFSLVIVAANAIAGQGGFGALAEALREVGGAALLGCAVGTPAAFLTGRIRKGQPLEAEALGVVFLTAGLALWLEVSFLLAGMVAGAIIANFARHHKRAFHEIEHLQWPFMILFFMLAGASIDFSALLAIGWIGAVFVVLRVVARIAGGYVGAWASGAPREDRVWFGPALLAQAGVAIGMALVAAEAFPQLKDFLLAVTIGSTVAFELLGPAATVWALRQQEKAAGKP